MLIDLKCFINESYGNKEVKMLDLKVLILDNNVTLKG